MTDKVRKITEATVLPISLIIMLAIGVWGASAINSKAQTAVDAAGSAQQSANDCHKTITRIDERLSRIEGKLDSAIGGP